MIFKALFGDDIKQPTSIQYIKNVVFNIFTKISPIMLAPIHCIIYTGGGVVGDWQSVQAGQVERSGMFWRSHGTKWDTSA